MREQIQEHLRVVERLASALPTLAAMADEILACFSRGGRLYLIGNGGSAADAQHIAAEFQGRFKLNRKALPAVALTTDTSTLTAVCNDYGGEHIFSRQVEALVTNKDLVWALSVSGTSPNVIAAVQTARRIGATTVGFTSQRGEKLARLCKHCLMVEHEESDRVQEAHCLAYHLICDRVEQAVAAPT